MTLRITIKCHCREHRLPYFLIVILKAGKLRIVMLSFVMLNVMPPHLFNISKEDITKLIKI